ncbi:MAG: VCBS repeat-containing protein [Lewinellaceae bacterium]|nr:VCBS repeat-containing protein [Lewinellaceae bacterium]
MEHSSKACPDIFPADPLEECGNYFIIFFDLTQAEPQLTGGVGGVVVNWYEDAAATVPIADPSAYEFQGATFVYARTYDGVCESAAIVSVELIVLSRPQNEPVILQQNVCPGQPVYVSVDIVGGEPPYSGSFTIGGQVAHSFSGVMSNSYGFVLIMDVPGFYSYDSFNFPFIQDANGCDNFDDVIYVNTLEVVNTSLAFPPFPNPLEACDTGNGEGQFDLTQLESTITSGNGQVSWYLTPGLQSQITFPASYTASSGSVYAVVEENGCASDPVEAGLLVISSDEPQIAGNLTLCPGESSVLSLTQAYASYSWSTGSNNSTIQVDQPGVYSVTVTTQTSQLSCPSETSVTVVQVPDPGLSLSCQQAGPATDSLSADGSASVSLQGNNPGFTLSWSGPQSGVLADVGAGTTSLTNLAAGDYQLTVEDAFGCGASCGFSVGVAPAVVCDRRSDSLALVEFYNATGGANWTNTWDLNAPMDSWYGVFLNGEGCVIKLDMDGEVDGMWSCCSTGNNLTGILMDIKLPKLQQLFLTQNNLSGSIPNFSNVPNLQRFDCSFNNFNGAIPDFSNTNNLHYFNCGYNNLTGNIPNFSNTPRLERFYCDGNNLVGGIPDFSNIPNLQIFNCSDNINLGSVIPNFSNTPNLIQFICDDNGLSGSIPDFSNIQNLEVFYCNSNELMGTIPEFSNLPNLESLICTENDLTGFIPDFSDNCPNLRDFTYDKNQYTFEDILPNILVNFQLINNNITTAYDTLIYAPQDSIFTDTLIARTIGESLAVDLGIDDTVTTNIYQWYKDGQPYAQIIGSNQLAFNNLQVADAGIYWVHITNPNALNLTLESYPIELVVDNNCGMLAGIQATGDTLCFGDTARIILTGIPMGGFTEHVISTNADGAFSVHAADLNGDNNLDILSASWYDDKIAWYENDGNGGFTERVISTSADGANTVYAADLNGDNHVDVLSASWTDNKIAWYENDGNGNFAERVISTNAASAQSVYAADLNGDNYIDVLSASAGDNKITWYENDGAGGFSEHLVSDNATFASAVFVSNINGDNFPDILSVSSNDNKIAWYEHDGSGNFTEHLISTNAEGASAVYAADLNGDSFVDALSASWLDNKIAWYENDGNGGFSERIIATNANGPRAVFAADVNSDNKMDVLSASTNDDKVAWYENDGNGNFVEHVISTTADYALSVYAAHLNSDNYLDVLSASADDAKIAWYEQLPNPVSPISLTYTIDNGPPQTAGNLDITNDSTAFSVPGLTGGSHTIHITEITDATGCVYTVDVFADCLVSFCVPLDVALVQDSVSCPGLSDGGITVTPAGGAAPYTFEWNTVPPDGSWNGPITITQAGESHRLGGLPAGQYQVALSDAGVPANTDTLFVEVLENPDVGINIDAFQTPGCFGNADGAVAARITIAGVPVSDPESLFSFQWNNSGETGATLQDIPAGFYSVTATDGNGCPFTASSALAQPAPLEILPANTNLANPLCPEDSTGSIAVTASGGTISTGNYTYEWSGGTDVDFAPSSLVDNLPAGGYSVTVTDDNGCTVEQSFTLSAENDWFSGIIAGLSAAPADCNGSNGAVQLELGQSPGTPAISWSTGASGLTELAGLASGTYSVTVSEAGCEAVAEAVVGTVATADLSGVEAIGDMVCADDTAEVKLAGFSGQVPSLPTPISIAYTINNGTPQNADNLEIANDSTIFSIPGLPLGSHDIQITEVIDANGCVYPMSLSATVLVAGAENQIDETICFGESYDWNGQPYTTPGSYQQTLTTTEGCDSLVTLNLAVLDEIRTNLAAEICAGEAYIVGDSSYTSSGDYTNILEAANGCDSTVSLNLLVKDVPETFLTEAICQPETFTVGTSTYSTTGNYTDVLVAANGCDSIVYLGLTVYPVLTTGLTVEICEGETYQVGTSIYSTDGDYQDTLASVLAGCDSIVNLNLTVTDVLISSFSASVCDGETYIWNDETYTVAGSYQQVLPTESCDSLVTLNLEVWPLPTIISPSPGPYEYCENEPLPIITLQASPGAAIDWYASAAGNDLFVQGSNTLTPTTPGDYYAEARDLATGCISLERVEVEVVRHPTALTVATTTTCIAAEAGVDTTFLSTIHGCDSLAVTTTNYVPAGEPTQVAQATCLPGNAGSDTLHLQSQEGCDSLVIVNTAYQPIPITTVTTTTCYWAQVGTERDTLGSFEGCDSIVVYDRRFDEALIKRLPDTTTCDDSMVGADTTFLSTLLGCDSLLVRDWLPAPPLQYSLDSTICEGESIAWAGQMLDETGVYEQALTTAEGCDSIVSLQLWVQEAIFHKVQDILCPGATYAFGNILITTPGVYTQFFTTEAGCDSTVELTLEGVDLEAVVLVPDAGTLVQGSDRITLRLAENDDLPGNLGWAARLATLPAAGTATVDAGGRLDYELTDPAFLGVDSFRYEICLDICPDTCKEATVHIHTVRDCEEELEANLPTGFTPDGDGVNDEYDPLAHVRDIGCLQDPQNAEMTIVSRWGEVVYEAAPYQPWDGRAGQNGKVVPQGVYYFILRFTLGEEMEVRGVVHVLGGR